MSVDTIIQEDSVNFRRKLIECFKTQHLHVFSLLEHTLSGHKNMIGIQVSDNGNVIGKYTLMLGALNVVEGKSGLLYIIHY
jgi:hypothetical protein